MGASLQRREELHYNQSSLSTLTSVSLELNCGTPSSLFAL